MNTLIENMKKQEKEVKRLMDCLWINSKRKKGDRNDT